LAQSQDELHSSSVALELGKVKRDQRQFSAPAG